MIIDLLEGEYNAIRTVLDWEADCLPIFAHLGAKIGVDIQVDIQSGYSLWGNWIFKSGFLGYCMDRGHKYRFFEIEA